MWSVAGRIRPISLLTLHPTNIARLKLSGKSPMGLGIPSLQNNIMLESNPLKPTMLVGGLAVVISVWCCLLVVLRFSGTVLLPVVLFVIIVMIVVTIMLLTNLPPLIITAPPPPLDK